MPRVANSSGGQAVRHAGFFVGSQAFYREPKEMMPEELAEICMTAISFTKTLHEDETFKRAQRPHARIHQHGHDGDPAGPVSPTRSMTAASSSGPGGQHDLVAMAHDLEGARSIMPSAARAAEAARALERRRPTATPPCRATCATSL